MKINLKQLCRKNSELLPLNGNDKFFIKDPTMETSSWCRPWFENYEGYADHYAEAAEQLYKSTTNNTRKKDSLVYPMMFLSRHSVELRLKSILHKLYILHKQNGSDMEKSSLNGHNLECLWNAIDKLYNGEKNGIYILAGERITELNQYDSKSDTFRYHIHKNNSSTAHGKFVDIDAFMNTYRKLNAFLEGIEAELQETSDASLNQ